MFIFESSAWYFNSLPSLLGLGEWMWKRQTGHRSHICHNLFDKAQKHAVAPVFLENTCYLCVDTNYIYNLWFLEVVTAPFFFFYCRFLISHRLMCSWTLPNVPLKSVSTSDACISKPRFSIFILHVQMEVRVSSKHRPFWHPKTSSRHGKLRLWGCR